MADLPARATGGDVTVALNRVVGAVKGDDGWMARRGEEIVAWNFSGTNSPLFSSGTNSGSRVCARVKVRLVRHYNNYYCTLIRLSTTAVQSYHHGGTNLPGLQ